MYHINNDVFSCVLKVVRLQSDIRNAVGKLYKVIQLQNAQHFLPFLTADEV